MRVVSQQFGRVLLMLGLGLMPTTRLMAEPGPPPPLTITSHGAAGQVSGSLHVLDTGAHRWMIDCGAFLAKKPAARNAARNALGHGDLAQTLPAGLESVDAVFLTHAHTDHVGRLPLLIDRGYNGPLYMTEPTAALAEPMLRVFLRYDRASIRTWSWSKRYRHQAESGGKPVLLHWRSCKYRREIHKEDLEEAACSLREWTANFGGESARKVGVVCEKCVAAHVADIMRLVKKVEYNQTLVVAPEVSVVFLDAGHIPGSASILFDVVRGATKRRILFSGDLGNGLSPLRAMPSPAPAVDAVVVETTYGPINRKPEVREQAARFRQAVGASIRGGGVVWIPCFALDRTQKILYELHLAQREKLISETLPIYCPSPTAKEITALYREHRKSGWFAPAVAGDGGAFSPREVFTTLPSGSRLPRPCVIISTSDLLGAPWMRRMLAELLPEPTTGVFLVGYQDPETAGELLLHGADRLEIEGQAIPIRAAVHSFSCFSGHADASDIDAWLVRVPKESAVILVHGGSEELNARAEQLRRQGRSRVIIAQPGKPIDAAS